MRKEKQRSCHICQRLGRTECGYHKFKDEFFSKMERSASKENYFAQTQSTLHGISEIMGHNNANLSLSPERINRTVINVPYRESAMRETPPMRIENSTYGHDFSRSPIHYQQREIQPQQRVIPIESHMIRQESGQTLFYPIYPVYEVIYQPVSVRPSSFTPSRLSSN